MDTWRPKMGYQLIYDRMPDGSQMKTLRHFSFFMECRATEGSQLFLFAQQEVDPGVSALRVTPTGVRLCGIWEWTPVKAIVAYFGIGWINYYRDRAVWMHNNHIGSRENAWTATVPFGGGCKPMPRISLRPACG